MFVMSCFKTQAEATFLAISDDAMTWTELNGGQPILQGTVNTSTMRDPFIMQARDGRFHLFCTDGGASQYIIHCSSADLLSWTEQVALPVMADTVGARNSWAPECYYDHDHDVYRVIWSSTVRVGEPELYRDHRIWSATTKDFERYTPASLFFDPGYNVIDASVGYHDGVYLMAFKDERGKNELGTDFKAIRVCTSKTGSGPFTDISGLVTPSPVEGPTLFRCDDRWMMFYDHFVENRYGASVSSDGTHWEVITDKITFPPHARHGSILEITDETIAKGLRSKV